MPRMTVMGRLLPVGAGYQHGPLRGRTGHSDGWKYDVVTGAKRPEAAIRWGCKFSVLGTSSCWAPVDWKILQSIFFASNHAGAGSRGACSALLDLDGHIGGPVRAPRLEPELARGRRLAPATCAARARSSLLLSSTRRNVSFDPAVCSSAVSVAALRSIRTSSGNDPMIRPASRQLLERPTLRLEGARVSVPRVRLLQPAGAAAACARSGARSRGDESPGTVVSPGTARR